MNFVTKLALLCLVGVQCLSAFDDPFDKIVGGEDAKLGEFPWQGSFRKIGIHICGATIIKEQWVITAAHCTAGWSNTAVTIVAGRLGKNGIEPTEQVIHVEKFFQNENFNNETFENDISLLKMSEPFSFNSYVNSIKFPKEKQQPFSGNCTVTGWGKLKSDGDYPTTLQKVSVPVLSDEECQKRFKHSKIQDSMMCTWAKDKDACEGDSGGPLVCQGDDGESYLTGITSWGIGCALLRFPGVYTEVSYFLDWINDIIENNS